MSSMNGPEPASTDSADQASQPVYDLTGVPRPNRMPADTTSGLEESVRIAIQKSVCRQMTELEVRTEGQNVIISGQAPSFYLRQVAEQRARVVVVSQPDKRLVSEIVVADDDSP